MAAGPHARQQDHDPRRGTLTAPQLSLPRSAFERSSICSDQRPSRARAFSRKGTLLGGDAARVQRMNSIVFDDDYTFCGELSVRSPRHQMPSFMRRRSSAAVKPPTGPRNFLVNIPPHHSEK